MKYRNLGTRGLRVSAVGLGCMGMSHAYGAPADRKDMTELLAKAVDLGYTFLIQQRCMVQLNVRTTTKSFSAMP